MPVFYLDDQPIEFEPGEKVLAAAMRHGASIPHYCYHPGLSVVATCRMCLVDVVDMGNGRPIPKLQTSCSLDASPNMKVVTKNEKVADAREVVMEFLLINHPLDCPICDQSGECILQDYSYDHGTGSSEMEYNKRVYGLRDVGTFIQLERNRCIHCTRCDRFTREITGTGEFGMFNRAHELTVDTFSDRPMVNKFQGNMADICPVGALTEKEFRFKRRAWRLKKTPSLCTGCSTGCNTSIEYDRNEVFRMKPRENQSVNRWWMCDDGRLTYRQMNERTQRVMKPLGRIKGELLPISWNQASEAIADRVRELAPEAGEVLALTDTQASNEELFLLKKLMREAFGSDRTFFSMPEWQQPESDFFINTLITTDRSPNRAGARELGLQGDVDGNLVGAATELPAKVVLLLGNPYPGAAELRERVANAQLIVQITPFQNEWSAVADVVLPGQLHSEKDVTYTNKDRRVQRTHTAVVGPRQSLPEWKVLSGLMNALGQDPGYASVEEVFESLGQEAPAFAGLSWSALPATGYVLPGSNDDPGRVTASAQSLSA